MKMLKVRFSSQIQKDLKRLEKRKNDLEQLESVIRSLISEEPLPPNRRDHALSGNWSGFRECHISPDWLLVYRIDEEKSELLLTRTGTHSDLFRK